MLSSTQALLLALGMAMLLGAGFFDLSLGANLVLSSVVGGLTIKAVTGPKLDDGSFANIGLAITLGVVAAVLTGVLFGLVNGILIAYLDVNSLIATLGTMGIGTGVALLVGGGGDVSGLPRELQKNFGQADFLGFVPLPTLIAIAAAVALWAMLRFTKFGLVTLAIGSSRSATERAGLKVKRHILALAGLAGGLAGVAGFIDISRYGSTAITGHTSDVLGAITAVVIGGTLLEGGRVSIVGAVWGTLLAVILQTGLVVIGVASFYQLIAVGVVLIIAVALDRFRARRRSR
ncbi:ABC transporter permease [Homoserinimonas aerilata]|uniref:ABC transporter permease n=1 Tax=Homoserinimonas aerilata TaxID=1162970 RepID=UPI00163B2A66|nr:ABC transporter permease [Homoserinimonas aerilata]